MKVLIACEFSGTVRDAFAVRGHDAWSCDILPSETPGNHFQCSILSNRIWKQKWDLLIAHPECTYLTSSGAAWMSIEWRKEAMMSSLYFVRALWAMPVEKIAIENPVGRLSTLWQKPTQIIQPYHFGHAEQKTTCLWLKGLPKLQPTNDVKAEMMARPKNERERLHYLPPSPDRWKLRSTTYEGIAKAMSLQWG